MKRQLTAAQKQLRKDIDKLGPYILLEGKKIIVRDLAVTEGGAVVPVRPLPPPLPFPLPKKGKGRKDDGFEHPWMSSFSLDAPPPVTAVPVDFVPPPRLLICAAGASFVEGTGSLLPAPYSFSRGGGSNQCQPEGGGAGAAGGGGERARGGERGGEGGGEGGGGRGGGRGGRGGGRGRQRGQKSVATSTSSTAEEPAEGKKVARGGKDGAAPATPKSRALSVANKSLQTAKRSARAGRGGRGGRGGSKAGKGKEKQSFIGQILRPSRILRPSCRLVDK